MSKVGRETALPSFRAASEDFRRLPKTSEDFRLKIRPGLDARCWLLDARLRLLFLLAGLTRLQ